MQCIHFSSFSQVALVAFFLASAFFIYNIDHLSIVNNDYHYHGKAIYSMRQPAFTIWHGQMVSLLHDNVNLYVFL